MLIYDRRMSEVICEIPGDSLVGRDMRKFKMRYADLSDQDLTDTIWDDMDLEGIQTSNAIASRIRMCGCNLHEAILSGIQAPRGLFNRSKMCITSFSRGVAPEADFSEIIIEGMVNFRWFVAPKAKFRKIKNLRGANFFEADLNNIETEGTDFTQVSESDRTGTIFTGTVYEYLMDQ